MGQCQCDGRPAECRWRPLFNAAKFGWRPLLECPCRAVTLPRRETSWNLHLLVGVSQTLWHWTEGATYIRQGDHHVGHWPTFLLELFSLVLTVATLQAEICRRERFLKGVDHFDRPLKVEGDIHPPTTVGWQKARRIALSCVIKISPVGSLD